MSGWFLPKEHGSWAVLIAPPLIGFAAAGGGSITVAVLFCAGLLAFFLARPPFLSWLKGQSVKRAGVLTITYSLIGAAAFAPLFLIHGRWELLYLAPLGAAALAVASAAPFRKRPTNTVSELAGIFALCIGAPAAAYALSGNWHPAYWGAYLLNVIFFVCPIFHVRLAVAKFRARTDPEMKRAVAPARDRSLLCHSAALAAAISLSISPLAPGWGWVPFLAALAKTARYSRTNAPILKIKQVGYREIAFSAFFLAWTAGTYAG